MALNFPDSPTLNQVFTSGSSSWQWNGVQWISLSVDSANLVAVYANDTLSMANANLNFNNTATINVAVSANATNKRANIAFSVNTAALGGGSDGNNYQADILANGTSVQTNASINFINTSTTTVVASANGAGKANVSFTVPLLGTTYDQANTARNTANSAYAQANAAYASANTPAVFANGTIVVSNTGNVNFNNTATVNVVASANGIQSNVSFTANGTALGIPTINSSLATMNSQILIAQNTVAVYDDGVLILGNSNLNFITTATSNALVTANGTSQVNVSFTVNTTSTGIVGAYNQANNAYTAANLGVGTANSAYSQANTARDTANSAYGQANNAYIAANLAVGTANSAYGQANTARDTANSAYAQANNAYTAANLAVGTANNSYGQANNAYGQANAAANLVAVYANGTIGMANANINFINTSTVNVNVTANATNKAANVAFSVNTSAVGGGGGNNYQADVLANGTVILANANLNFLNTATVNVAAAANGTTQANISFIVNTTGTGITTALSTANSAYGQANNAYTAANLGVGTANSAYGQANNAYIAANLAVGTANSAYGQANAAYGQANTARDTANGAYAQANGAYGQANAAYGQANTARDTANGAYAQANGAYGQANGAYAQANAAANTVAVHANGTLTLAKGNINFNNTATVNVSLAANGTTQTNIAFTVNTAAVTSGGGTPGGSNTQIQFNNNGSFGGSANLTYNLTSNSVSFGSGIASRANARLQISAAGFGNPPSLGTSNSAQTSLAITNSDSQYGLLFGISGSGWTWMQSQRLDGTATAYDLIMQASGGNVGIGTTSPQNILHINGGSGSTVVRVSDGTNGTLGFLGSSSGLITGTPANNLALRAENGLFFSGGGNAPHMKLDNSGNFLVGTSASNWGTSGRGVIEVNGSGAALIGLKVGDVARAYLYHDSSSSYLVSASGQLNIQTATAVPIIFAANSSEAVRILSGGDVGIGISSPAARLQIQLPVLASTHSARLSTIWGDLYNAGVNGQYLALLTLSSGGGFAGWNFYSTWGGRLSLGASSAGYSTTPVEQLTIQPTGNVGIGVTSPTSKFNVVDTGARLHIGYNTTDNYLDGSTTYIRTFSGSNILVANNTGLHVIPPNNAYFGSTTRQMVNLYGVSYGIGVQSSTQYYRSDGNFAWYVGGSHNDNPLNAGGGSILITSNSSNTWINSSELAVGGNAYITKALHNKTAGHRIPMPEGGTRYSSSATETGYLKISLPTAKLNSDTMIMFTLDVYEYNSLSGVGSAPVKTFVICGYNYSSGGWYNYSATCISGGNEEPYEVRWGHDGTRNVIWIGSSGTVWDYPQVVIRDVYAGYAGFFTDGWQTGWAITIDVTLGGTVTNGPSKAYNAITSNGDNSAWMLPNGSGSSYTPWRIQGSKNTFGGMYDAYSGVSWMFDSSGNGGFYREANGQWQTYWHQGNSCLGIGSSTTSSSYKLYVSGAIYASGAITSGTGILQGSAPIFAENIYVGTASSATGKLYFRGVTSGTVTMTSAAAAGTWTFTLPTTAGSSGQYLQTDGAGTTTWATVTSGGTPGGSSTQMQYNNGGSFGGTSGLTWDATRTVLQVGNIADATIVSTASSISANENTAGKVIVCDSASAITVTFTSAAYAGFSITVVRKNTGNVTIAAGAGVTKLNTAGFISSNLASRYSSATVLYTSTTEFILIGDIT